MAWVVEWNREVALRRDFSRSVSSLTDDDTVCEILDEFASGVFLLMSFLQDVFKSSGNASNSNDPKNWFILMVKSFMW